MFTTWGCSPKLRLWPSTPVTIITDAIRFDTDQHLVFAAWLKATQCEFCADFHYFLKQKKDLWCIPRL